MMRSGSLTNAKGRRAFVEIPTRSDSDDIRAGFSSSSAFSLRASEISIPIATCKRPRG